MKSLALQMMIGFACLASSSASADGARCYDWLNSNRFFNKLFTVDRAGKIKVTDWANYRVENGVEYVELKRERAASRDRWKFSEDFQEGASGSYRYAA